MEGQTQDNRREKFTFFYHTKSPFSQFHPAKFQGSIKDSNELLVFQHCEQWMMYNKAKLFGDEKAAKEILQASIPSECKGIGRRVKNFDQEIWNQHNKRIIYEGNYFKFTQNPHLFKALMLTDGTTLVEASPTDCIYGIGLSESNPKALNRKTWRGKNLLGEVLTELREALKVEMAEVNVKLPK